MKVKIGMVVYRKYRYPLEKYTVEFFNERKVLLVDEEDGGTQFESMSEFEDDEDSSYTIDPIETAKHALERRIAGIEREMDEYIESTKEYTKRIKEFNDRIKECKKELNSVMGKVNKPKEPL